MGEEIWHVEFYQLCDLEVFEMQLGDALHYELNKGSEIYLKCRLTGRNRGFISLEIRRNMKIMNPCSSFKVTEMMTLAIKFIPWQ